MSTFNGIIKEIPYIQVDYFRRHEGTEAPLANFLSHIHSDHLTGLAGKNYGAPFIYCSEATKFLLMRLQRRYHWYNEAKGTLDSVKYAYLDIPTRKTIVKTIPLETPTIIELKPGVEVRVTLFEANHCPGATMFLFETKDKAVLYTGDIRAERWWIEVLKRHPVLVPYTSGIKTLDKIYLDTSNANPDCTNFSSKSQGIAELIRRIDSYPADTFFHINTWTFGYEEVWVAIASYYNTYIHLNDYKFNFFRDLKDSSAYIHGPFLKGLQVGNVNQRGVLTRNTETRFHSCDLSLECPVIKNAERAGKLVYISPLVRKYVDEQGQVVIEKEAGEGSMRGDLDFKDMLEVNMELLIRSATSEQKQRILNTLKALGEEAEIPLLLEDDEGDKDINIEGLFGLLDRYVTKKNEALSQSQIGIEAELGKSLNWFGFPFARHSSFDELRDFVAAFRPRSVYPCVVNSMTSQGISSIHALFSDLCSNGSDTELNDYIEEEKEDDEYQKGKGDDTNQTVTQEIAFNEPTVGEEYETQRSEGDTTIDGDMEIIAIREPVPPSSGISTVSGEIASRTGMLALSSPGSKRALATIKDQACISNLQFDQNTASFTKSSSQPIVQPDMIHGDTNNDIIMYNDQDDDDEIDLDIFLAGRQAAMSKDGSEWFAKSANFSFHSNWRSKPEREL